MIHSLSGGILSDNEVYTFVKVEVEGTPHWYLSPFAVKAGDKVAVPIYGQKATCEGVVLRVENCTKQVAPVPLNRVLCIDKVPGA